MSDKRLARGATSEPGVILRASAKGGHWKHPPAAYSSSSYVGSDVNAPVGKPTQRRRRKTNHHMASTVFNTDPDPPKNPFASSTTTVAARVSRRNSVKSHENIFGGGPEDRSDGPIPWRPKRRICQTTRRKDTVGSLFGGGGVDEPVSANCQRSYGGDTHRRLFGREPGTDSATVNRTGVSGGGGGGGGGGYEDTKEKLFGHVGPPPVLRALRRPGSRSENTQDTLFGPPLPVVRKGRVRLSDRSSFDLFKTQETGGRGGPGAASPSTAPAKGTLRGGEAKTQAKLLDDQATRPLTGLLRSDSSVQTE